MDVALGSVYAGVFSSDDELWNQLQTATDLTSDLFWRMPLHIDYLKQMRSSGVADLCNLGSNRRSAGSCTAAAFLQEFVAGLETPKETENGEDEVVESHDKKIRWAHVDIAGVMENTGNHAYNVKGMSGRPTRSILEFARQFGAQ
jgi:cytosol aminopeptidase